MLGYPGYLLECCFGVMGGWMSEGESKVSDTSGAQDTHQS